MTYCLGILVEEGLLLASDSRSNAGFDQIVEVTKLSLLPLAPDRIVAIQSAGNLATTQTVITMLREAFGGLVDHRVALDEPALVAEATAAVALAGEGLGVACRDLHLTVDLVDVGLLDRDLAGLELLAHVRSCCDGFPMDPARRDLRAAAGQTYQPT